MQKFTSCGETSCCVCIPISDSIRCFRTCSLLASRALSHRKQFPAISQSQFLISDACWKKSSTLSAILYLFSTITTRRRSTYQCRPNPDHSQQHIWRLLALTEVTDLIFDAFGMCFALFCTFPLVIVKKLADRLNQKMPSPLSTEVADLFHTVLSNSNLHPIFGLSSE